MINILKRKIQLIVGRCVINTIKNDKYQIELFAGETRDDIEIMQHFGFKSIPLKESKGVTLSVGGLRDDTIIIATSNETAPTVNEGETTLYNNFTERLELLEEKLNLVGKEINITGDTTNINGSSKQLVTYSELDTAIQSLMIQLNTHTHLVGYLGAPTGPASASTPPINFSVDISASKTTTINVE